MSAKKAELLSSTAEHRYLTLGLGEEFLCLPIANVLEIGEFESITQIPGTPSWLKGVLNLRGEILSVVDITSFLGLPALQMGRQTRMVVVEGKSYVAAILADAVLEVITIPPKEIQSVEDAGVSLNKTYARGVFVSRDLLYTVLDAERLLACEPMMQFQ